MNESNDPGGLAIRACDVSVLLEAMANPARLRVLCRLLDGECSAGALAVIAGLSPAALSQHLARLRHLGIVETRRGGQTIHYRLVRADVRALLATLDRLFCTTAP